MKKTLQEEINNNNNNTTTLSPHSKYPDHIYERANSREKQEPAGPKQQNGAISHASSNNCSNSSHISNNSAATNPHADQNGTQKASSGTIVMDEVNFRYLKHVIIKFLTSREVRGLQFLNFAIISYSFPNRWKRDNLSKPWQRCFSCPTRRRNFSRTRSRGRWAGSAADVVSILRSPCQRYHQVKITIPNPTQQWSDYFYIGF